ncbi:MAG: PEGA domain-containing protein [Acidobacteriota bacterium]
MADPSVGVVVPGTEAIHSKTQAAVIAWLGKQKIDIAPTPLDKDGLLTLSNCLAIADMACARGVVEKRASADSVVVIVAQTAGPKKKRDLQLSAYWITKQHDVVSLQRMCSHCTDDVLPTTIDGLMIDLSHLVPAMTGRIMVASKPSGLLAMVDNDAIGMTPVTHDLTPGKHHVEISRDGKIVETRDVTVSAGKTTEVVIDAPAPPPPQVIDEHRSRAVPAVMIGVGVAGIATGAVMYAIGGPTGDQMFYTDRRTPGYYVAGAGAGVAVIGAIWFLVGGSSSSTPTVGLAPGHGYVGWAGRF